MRERISLNGVPISEKALSNIVEKYNSYFEGLSYFEVITLCALIYFKQENISLIVLETGMGGRLDATNVCHPLVSVITNVGRDHMHHLGHSLPAILKEKTGICKKNTPLVTGVGEEQLKKNLEQSICELNVPTYYLGDEFTYEVTQNPYPCLNHFKYYSDKMKLSIEGLSWWSTYHGKNAALVVKVIELLRERSFSIDDEHIEKGLKIYYWPGRMETISEHPLVIFDCAHNEHGVNELVRSLMTYYGNFKKYFLVSVSKDKEWAKMLHILSEISQDICIAPYAQDRSWNVAEVPSKFKKFSSIREGHETIRSLMGQDDMLCLTGSIYAVAEAKGQNLIEKK